jgi:hypothetical protein
MVCPFVFRFVTENSLVDEIFILISSLTGLLNNAQLPIHEFEVPYAGSVHFTGQHLSGIPQVGDEEAPSSSSSKPRATSSRQGIGKGRGLRLS